jgi:hypothetical protein
MKYGIKDAANLTIKKKSDGSIFLYADYANVTTNDWTSDSVYAKSKGVDAIRWDGNKKSTLQVDMETYDLKWLSMLSGADWIVGATNILKRDVLTADATNKVNLSAVPTAGSLAIFLLESDNVTNGEEQTVGTPATTVNTYSITEKAVTLNATSCPTGTKVVAYYLSTSGATAKKIEFKYDKFPENFDIYGDTMIRAQETGVDSFVQIHYPNTKPQANFSITMDASNPTNLSIKFDLFPDSNGDMATYTIID